jgi:hypothetical protein
MFWYDGEIQINNSTALQLFCESSETAHGLLSDVSGFESSGFNSSFSLTHSTVKALFER